MKRSALAAIAALSIATASAASLDTWQEDALALVKAEARVLDARWRMRQTNVLWVSMDNDGTRRDGFAEYLCTLLTDAGAPQGELKTVFIHAPAAFETGGDALGIAACR